MRKRPKREKVLINDLQTGEFLYVAPAALCTLPIAFADPDKLPRTIPRPRRPHWCGTLACNVRPGQYAYVLAADEAWHLAQVEPPLN